MPYFLTLTKGQTYDLQGFQFRYPGHELEVPKAIYEYAQRNEQFVGRTEEVEGNDDIDTMDKEALEAYAAAHGVDLGRAKSEEGYRQKIRDHFQAQQEDEPVDVDEFDKDLEDFDE